MSLVAGMVALWSARAVGIERKPLPAFTLVALDGSATASGDLARDGDWLLVYLQPACASCDTLLRTIDQDASPIVSPRTVVAIGADVTVAARLAAGFSNLQGVAWYADPGGTMKQALPLAGAPVVFGMRGTMVEWSLAGVVPDAAAMRTALLSWVALAR